MAGEILSLPVQLLLGAATVLATVAATWGVMRTKIGSLEARMKQAESEAQKTKDDLSAFKLEAARTFVSAGALAKIEGQMEAGFNAIRQELRDTNATIVAAILNGQHPVVAPRSKRGPSAD